MNIKVSDGLNIVSIGYNSLGSYYKFYRPVSLLWDDCAGSVGQYLSLLPSTPGAREVLQDKINTNLFEDFTGREDALYEILKPLFGLFQNGEYHLSFNNGTIKQEATVSSGNETRTYEMKWYVVYPEPVDLSKIDEIKRNYKQHRYDNKLERFSEDLVSYTSTSIYDWENMFYIATRPKSQIDNQRVDFFIEKIQKGERPFIIIMDAFYEAEEGYTGEFILDGHHKLEAYMKLGIDPPRAVVTRQINSVDELEFDIESLGLLLYPWQIRHILNNWNEKDAQLPKLMQNPESRIGEFVRLGDYKEYHDNGKLKHEGFYVYDRPEGLIKEYFDTGKPKFEKNYHRGRHVGVWRYWYETGQLKSVQSFNDFGQLNGQSASYLEDGRVQVKNAFVNGIPADGYSYVNYGHTGNLDFEFWHKGGKLIEQKSYSDDGSQIRHERFSAESHRLVEIPVTKELKDPKLLKDKSDNKSIWPIKEIVIILAIIALMLVKCFGQ